MLSAEFMMFMTSNSGELPSKGGQPQPKLLSRRFFLLSSQLFLTCALFYCECLSVTAVSLRTPGKGEPAKGRKEALGSGAGVTPDHIFTGT